VVFSSPKGIVIGSVTLAKSAQSGWLDHAQLRLELIAALAFPATIIVLRRH